jgi:hypothetical protein
MTYKIMLWSTYVLEVIFFTGLTGCALVVVISWISIFRSGFTREVQPVIHVPAESHRSSAHTSVGSQIVNLH